MSIHNYTDLQIISSAIGMWINHIETGDSAYSAVDAKNCGHYKMIKKLKPEQITFLDRLHKLRIKALTQDSNTRSRQPADVLRDVTATINTVLAKKGTTLSRVLSQANPSLAKEHEAITKSNLE